jgi:hypothetical protein
MKMLIFHAISFACDCLRNQTLSFEAFIWVTAGFPAKAMHQGEQVKGG